MQAGIRCVPISPLVLAPQMKKLPASSQKSRERRPDLQGASAATKGLPAAGSAGRGLLSRRCP